MKAIILAAGVGSRLRPLTNSTPKCLVPVAGRPILAHQIEALRRAGIEHTTIVAGYRASEVVEFCQQFGQAASVIVNAAYDRSNNMVSLRLALRDHEHDPVVICNGDVVFDSGIVDALLERDGNGIATEPGRFLEESMKVSVDESGRITALSKAIEPAAAYGVSIDLYRFSGAAMAAICRTADRLINDEGMTNLWTEVAIDAILRDVEVRPVDIAGRRWVEIDNFDDLAEADRLFSTVTI